MLLQFPFSCFNSRLVFKLNRGTFRGQFLPLAGSRPKCEGGRRSLWRNLAGLFAVSMAEVREETPHQRSVIRKGKVLG